MNWLTCRYNDDFKYLVGLKDYPLKGFWFRMMDTSESGSDIYPTNTFIMKDRKTSKLYLRISYKTDSGTLLDSLAFMNFYYLDILTQEQKVAFKLRVTTGTRAGGVWDEFKYSDRIHILNIPYDNEINCSFEVVNNGIPQTEHFMSDNMGAYNYYAANGDDERAKQLITKFSGEEHLRDTLTEHRLDHLNGTMTIKKSGIIQL